MAILTIRQKEDPVLRQLAKPVPTIDFDSTWLSKLVGDMSTTLAACQDGVALAAPQIGESWRVFIIGERAFPQRDTKKPWSENLVFINPIITRRSRRQLEVLEGCLSVASCYGTIKRHERVSVAALDLHGDKFTRHASGLLAQIFQHEIEHLDGILFIDQAWNLHDVDHGQGHV
ncbi:MAG TPA: peptide deformylase [Candidatus Paceibacterota bacterium]